MQVLYDISNKLKYSVNLSLHPFFFPIIILNKNNSTILLSSVTYFFDAVCHTQSLDYQNWTIIVVRLQIE